MSVVVHNRRIHISSRKVRQVCDLIRKKKASEALKVLRFCEKKEISLTVTKLINSALAIADVSKKYDLENLVVSTIMANEGPTLKRIQARAQGRAFRIRKRTTHLTIELKEE